MNKNVPSNRNLANIVNKLSSMSIGIGILDIVEAKLKNVLCVAIMYAIKMKMVILMEENARHS
jgi:hypothetical protein